MFIKQMAWPGACRSPDVQHSILQFLIFSSSRMWRFLCFRFCRTPIGQDSGRLIHCTLNLCGMCEKTAISKSHTYSIYDNNKYFVVFPPRRIPHAWPSNQKIKWNAELLTAFLVLCWFSSVCFNGFTISSSIAVPYWRCTSPRLSISAATPRHASAKLPGISRHVLFSLPAIFDNDLAYNCSASTLWVGEIIAIVSTYYSYNVLR